MSVTDLVRLGRYPHTGWTGKFTGEDQRKVAEAISMAGIESLSRRYINELSDGERQRAMIARVLAQDADILLLDEPTAFLDVRSRYEIVHLLHDLSVRRSKTIIFSTHDLLTAIGESDRVLLLFRDFYALGSPEDMVLNGSFEKLFKDSVVRFNASDASFNFMKKSHGDVYIEGTGMARYWTEKAAARVGFEISGPGSGIKIRILAEGNEMRWLAESGNSRYECRSLYELVNWLKQRIEVN
jgi:iron complex transport system ATP-binding protein